VFVSDEVDVTLRDIFTEIDNRPFVPVYQERLTEKSTPTYNLPAITVNMPAQEVRSKDDEMNIIINNPASVQMESDKQAMAMKAITESIEKVSKAMDANSTVQPHINVQVNPTPVTIQNDVNVAPVNPEVTVNVQPTPITVESPTVKVDVKVPRAQKETQKVNRDRMGNISSTETDITYE
jgi:hypothetical protein